MPAADDPPDTGAPAVHLRDDGPTEADPSAAGRPTGSLTAARTTATLLAEQHHLATARSELHTMRARVLELEATGGNAVADDYLRMMLDARAMALLDDLDTPLFFGRIDVTPADGATGETPFYIGRRHVHDDAGDPVVVDWRAGISRAFYRATRADTMGVGLRRRFGYDGGRLTAYEDERLDGYETSSQPSAVLVAEIEKPRMGPMRDIVSTIAPEQDVVVRTDVEQTICVQGAPGTGKTAVGLHRAAYLLYAYRDRLRRSGVLVVGPNRSFLSYIAQVLPALGEVATSSVTLEELVGRVPLRGEDTPAGGRLKGDPRMAAVVRRAVWSAVRRPDEALVVPRGSRRWRVTAHDIQETLDELVSRDVRYGSARTMLAQRLAHFVLVQMERAGDSADDRVQDAVARSRPVRALVDSVWPAVDPVRLVLRLLSDRGFLTAAADGILSEFEQELVAWSTPARGPATARWSLADAVLVDEAADVVDRQPSHGHVVLDEAQDLSPMALRAVGRRCSTGSATVLGDIAQGTTPWATTSWDEALVHLGKPGAHVEVLTRGYRVPAQVIDFAARLLPRIAPGMAPPQAVRENTGRLRVESVTDLATGVVAAVEDALAGVGLVGVVAADNHLGSLESAFLRSGLTYGRLGAEPGDDRTLSPRLTLVPASLVKGLEYDRVVVVEPAAIVAGESEEFVGLRRL